ncbi:hypothetical protein NFI96_023567 [Prochilodus magdalenae]|nr:hypothetical protein NFI96_023567 [Prochilodus magdalenae]
MKRRKVVVAAGFCLSFFLGTLFNLLSVPAFEHQQHQQLGKQQQQQQQLEASLEPTTAAATSGHALLRSLRLQIRARLREALRYGPFPERGARPLERRRLMDLQRAHEEEREHGGARRLGCSSVDAASDVRFVGSGYTKAVYRAALNGSFAVALKSVDFGGHDMEECVRRYGSAGDCYRLASVKLVKEMALMERLQHPNILKHYCFNFSVPSNQTSEKMNTGKYCEHYLKYHDIRFLPPSKLYGYCYQDSNDIKDTVTAITELGSPLEMIQLLQTPWEERFRICLSLTRLLHYLAHSPLGSLTLLDFRPRQFVLVNGELKVTDLDDASVEETPCSSSADCLLEFPARNFTLQCSSGRCQGINEKRNLYNAYRFFFTYLLPHSAPPALRPLLDKIVNSTGELLWGTDETLAHLEKVLDVYRSGQYLMNDTQTHKTAEYKRVVDASIPGENYRCWPSYQHDGCMLSVYDVREAVGVCESHAQCRAFVLTNQSTWTGHQLALFKTSSAGMASAKGKLTKTREEIFRPHPPLCAFREYRDNTSEETYRSQAPQSVRPPPDDLLPTRESEKGGRPHGRGEKRDGTSPANAQALADAMRPRARHISYYVPQGARKDDGIRRHAEEKKGFTDGPPGESKAELRGGENDPERPCGGVHSAGEGRERSMREERSL